MEAGLTSVSTVQTMKCQVYAGHVLVSSDNITGDQHASSETHLIKHGSLQWLSDQAGQSPMGLRLGMLNVGLH